MERVVKIVLLNGAIYHLVPKTGLEPVRPFERQILSLLRLPIPPLGHVSRLPRLDIAVVHFFLQDFEQRHPFRLVDSFAAIIAGFTNVTLHTSDVVIV